MTASAGAPAVRKPSIALLLAPLTRGLSETERPAFLARLERLAAERYRAWAQQAPQHASTLLACAASEEEIADRTDRLIPLRETQRAKLDALVPEARHIYGAVFVGLELHEQLTVQASAERQGADVWRAIASSPGVPQALRDELAAFAELEEASAVRIEKLLEQGRA